MINDGINKLYKKCPQINLSEKNNNNNNSNRKKN